MKMKTKTIKARIKRMKINQRKRTTKMQKKIKIKKKNKKAN